MKKRDFVIIVITLAVFGLLIFNYYAGGISFGPGPSIQQNYSCPDVDDCFYERDRGECLDCCDTAWDCCQNSSDDLYICILDYDLCIDRCLIQSPSMCCGIAGGDWDIQSGRCFCVEHGCRARYNSCIDRMNSGNSLEVGSNEGIPATSGSSSSK